MISRLGTENSLTFFTVYTSAFTARQILPPTSLIGVEITTLHHTFPPSLSFRSAVLALRTFEKLNRSALIFVAICNSQITLFFNFYTKQLACFCKPILTQIFMFVVLPSFVRFFEQTPLYRAIENATLFRDRYTSLKRQTPELQTLALFRFTTVPSARLLSAQLIGREGHSLGKPPPPPPSSPI